MFLRSRRTRLGLLGVASVSATLLAFGTLALAAQPDKGQRYSGNVDGAKVSFKVARNGRTVKNLTVSPAPGCSGAKPANSQPISAHITKQGTFKTSIPLTVTSGGGTKTSGSETVTGKFMRGGKEAGQIKVKVNPGVCFRLVAYQTHD